MLHHHANSVDGKYSASVASDGEEEPGHRPLVQPAQATPPRPNFNVAGASAGPVLTCERFFHSRGVVIPLSNIGLGGRGGCHHLMPQGCAYEGLHW